jgi:hypothetical protein
MGLSRFDFCGSLEPISMTEEKRFNNGKVRRSITSVITTNMQRHARVD